MSFRVQRRLRLTRGLGLNISKSGISPSVQTSVGSIGAKGFSIRPGIPGVYYRKSWVKNSGIGAIVGLVLVILAIIPPLLALLYWAVRIVFWLVVLLPINFLVWLFPTLGDYIRYRRQLPVNSTSAGGSDDSEAQRRIK